MYRSTSELAAFFAVLFGSAALFAAPTMSVTMNPKDEGGARIAIDGAQLVKGTRFTVHSPGWTDRYVRNIVNPRHVKVNFKKTENGVFESVTETLDNVAVLDEYSVKCEGNTAVITTRAALRKKKQAQVETVFGLAPWVCENARYEVVTADGKKLAGRLPEEELSSQFEGAANTSAKIKLLPPIVKGVFRTTRGVVTVEVVEGPALALEDRRTSRTMAWGKSYILWSSDSKMPKPGKSFRQVVKVRYDLPEKSELPLVGSSISAESCAAVECSASPAPDFPLLPRPKSCKFTGAGYKVQTGDKLIIPGNSARFARHAGKFADRYGLEVVADADAGARGIRIVYGDNMDDESYTIRMDANGATVRAKGERGAFYALWTLRGLERNGVFKCADIDDAPAFAKRAIHANADSDTRTFTGEMVEKVFAPLKINTIILECPYIRWKALEGKYRRKGMPLEDLPAFLDIAEEYYIKVYPLIPTFSHSEWFFWGNKDTDLRENPRDPRSYNSLDPRVYEKLSALFDEVLKAFRDPEYFHISHDELYEQPTTDAGKKFGIVELFRRDIMWHYSFFKKRGVKLMMWHDMLVSKAENHNRAVANARGGTEKLRKVLPKDIVVCMWDYYATSDGKYYQIDHLQKDGFPVWCAGWFYPDNLEKLSSYAHEKKVGGMIETTWHNKVGSGGLLQTQYPQLRAYIRAAAYFWNPEYRKLPDTAKTYRDLMRPEALPAKTVHPVKVNCNTLLAGDGDDFEKLPAKLVTADGMAFRIAKRDGKTGAVMVKTPSKPEFPAKVRIPIKGTCRRMYILHTTLAKAIRPDGITVKLVFRYKDGSVEAVWPRNNIDIAYGTPPEFKESGKVVTRVSEVGTPRNAWTFYMNHHNVFEWRNVAGAPRRIWYLEWDNPHPERELDHLLVEAVPNGGEYALLAVSLEK